MDQPPKSRKGRRFVKRLLLAGGSIVVALLLGELAVRAFLGEVPKFPRCVVGADYGLRTNLPGAHYRQKSADVCIWFDINQHGLRDTREFPYQKPQGRKRIVSLGDSFTIGYEVAAEDTFSSVLERELRAAGQDVEVLNAGVSGYSNAEECLLLEREMLKYDPDVVIVSYYVNDNVDNTRTGLFTLDPEDHLQEAAHDYVPGGWMADFLNRNPLVLWLSEYSDLFALVKERSTLAVKKDIVKENLRELDQGQDPDAVPGQAGQPVRRRRLLVGRILDRMYDDCHSRGIPLIVQSIPGHVDDPERLVDTFPRESYFHRDRPGLYFLSAKELLMPYLGKEQLYWERSHKHWTPFSHAQSGAALAEIVLEHHLLDGRE